MSEQADRERAAHRQWARPGGRHDFSVRWLNRLLPMGVGALAAILIVSPFVSTHGEISFVLSKNSVDMASERLRIIAATYRGKDADGRAFELNAGSAIQASSQVPIVKVADISAIMQMKEGPSTVTAAHAEYEIEQEVVRVVGPVSVKTGDGYNLEMTNVAINLRTKQVTNAGSVAVKSPDGYNLNMANVSADLQSKQIKSAGANASQSGKGSVSGGAMSADLNSKKASISGGVSGSTPLGSFRGGKLEADLAARRVTVTGGVSGETKFGSYSAGEMIADQNARTLSLRGRARLIVYPRGLR